MLLWVSLSVLGTMRYQTYLPETAQIPYDQTITFTGSVSKPPILQNTSQKLYITSTSFPGKVYIKTGQYPVYVYGDTLSVTCTLRQPQPIEDFAFDKYLARYGVLAICERAKLESLHNNIGNPIIAAIYKLRYQIVYQVQQLWPEPVASLILGVLTGIQDTIPQNIVQEFQTTGTIHVLVVSGMHVMIVIQLILRIGQRWLPKRVLFIGVIILLFGLCVLTGLAASVIRASIMGILPLIAQLAYRRPVMHYSLAFVCAIIGCINPYIVVYDVGFQLSLLATIGLIYFEPLCNTMFWWVPQRLSLRETLSTTFAASIPTLPLLLSVFGSFAVISPVANLIVIPVTNLMLFAGVGISIVQLFLPNLAIHLAYILYTIVQWMLVYIHYLSSVSWANITHIHTPTFVLIIMYSLIIGYIVWRVHISKFATSSA